MASIQGSPQRFSELMEQADRDVAASRVVIALVRASSRISQQMEEATAQAGITRPQFFVLMEVASSPAGSLALRDVSAGLGVTPASASWLCHRMEEDGLLDRTREESDARVLRIELTRKGWSTLGKVAPLVFEAEKAFLAPLPRSKYKTLTEFLRQLVR
ncbi:MAG TPA: MarR family transcriptional regulator [Actinomycetota bacterium]|nr:MarR family transcriptional regulator [Actinomycetota bacterium]